MSDDQAMLQWYENQDIEELLKEFLNKEKMFDKWEEFLNDRWISDEADAADAMWDAYKDYRDVVED